VEEEKGDRDTGSHGHTKDDKEKDLEREVEEEQHMKEKKEGNWEFYDDTVEVEGETIRGLLQSLLALSSIGAKIVVTDFLGTVLLEEDLEKRDLYYLDQEPFVVPVGPRFLVPRPVDKEGKRVFFERTYVPSFLILPKMKMKVVTVLDVPKDRTLEGYPVLDHPYYVWTEVPEEILGEILGEMKVNSPIIVEVKRGDVEA
jgi:hypothetical protein